MKKILVTGTRFTGSITLIYGEPENMQETQAPLLKVELEGAALDDNQKVWVLKCVPVRYGAGYEQNWGGMTGKIQIVTDDYELDFERDFFKPYGKAINKARCIKLWAVLGNAEKALAVSRLGAYMRYLSRTGIAKADPESYLRKKYFLNDYDNIG